MTATTGQVLATKRHDLPNALSHYYEDIRLAAAAVRADRPADGDGAFSPSFELPPITAELRQYLAPSELAFAHLGEYRGVRLALLDLMRNPRTRTTKTLASLLMVARAVHHIQRTGQRIMILTPSSANKATALRDAVLRAVECGLVTPDQLRIVVVVPEAARAKLWSSALSDDPRLRQRNPVLVFPGADRVGVKTLAKAVADKHGDMLHALTGFRLWYSLDIDNYRVADAARAFFERDVAPVEPGVRRLHAHAVSSAYGLLGHHLGHVVSAAQPPPRYFLVQHLDTPDMVLSLHFGSTDRTFLPRYTADPETGLYQQSTDPRFPYAVHDPSEVLDSTFYTHAPPTSARMNELIHSAGGGGVVVSLHECLERYPYVRRLLAESGPTLPADPRELREWSLLMAFTGVLNAIDRGLITDDEVVVHASGSYSSQDFVPVPPDATRRVETTCDVRQAVYYAALVDSREPAEGQPS